MNATDTTSTCIWCGNHLNANRICIGCGGDHNEFDDDEATNHLYLDDNGRATCADHAGAYLKTSILSIPDAQFHKTPLGTWERFTADDIRLFGDGIDCETCARHAKAAS